MPNPDFPGPDPKPISGISPSLANQLLACQLRVGFSRDADFKGLRRPSTYSLLGEVAHAVTESAFRWSGPRDSPDLVRAAIEELWDEEVVRASATLSSAWAPASPPPPAEWPGYQLTRARTVRRATRQVSTSGPPKSGTPGGTDVEIELTDPETGLFGRADRIERRGGSTRVVDLKTGLRQAEPTEDQTRQLLLYAVLAHRSTGEWPAELAIEDASGAQSSIVLESDVAESALSEVMAAVGAFNEHIEAKDLVDRAEPTADRCRWCAFRVACGPYWEALHSDWGHRSALGGVVASDESAMAGFALLQVESPVDLAGTVLHISALASPPAEGSTRMAVTDLAGDPARGDVRARWSTNIRSW